jgi:hypothetical protein
MGLSLSGIKKGITGGSGLEKEGGFYSQGFQK